METIILVLCVYYTSLKGSKFILNKLFSKDDK